MRDARSATSFECVTITIVAPCAVARARAALSTSSSLVESRLPVGSSSRSTLGCTTSARATATRCCSPPESCVGRWAARSERPTSPSAGEHATATLARRDARVHERQLDVAIGRSSAAAGCRPGRRSRSARPGRARGASRRASPSPRRRACTSRTDGRSRQPRMPSRVVLPEPDGPMIATNSPSRTTRLTRSQRLDGDLARLVDLADARRAR